MINRDIVAGIEVFAQCDDGVWRGAYLLPVDGSDVVVCDGEFDNEGMARRNALNHGITAMLSHILKEMIHKDG